MFLTSVNSWLRLERAHLRSSSGVKPSGFGSFIFFIFTCTRADNPDSHMCWGREVTFWELLFQHSDKYRHLLLQPNIANCNSSELGFRIVLSLSCMQSVTFSTGKTKILHQIQVSFDDFQKVQQKFLTHLSKLFHNFRCYITIHFITSRCGKILEHSKISCLSFLLPIVKFFHEMRWGCHWNRQLSFPFLVVSDLLIELLKYVSKACQAENNAYFRG